MQHSKPKEPNLNRKRANLREQGILLESGCEIGDGKDLADWREEGAVAKDKSSGWGGKAER